MITGIEFEIYRNGLTMKLDECEFDASFNLGLPAFIEALEDVKDDPDILQFIRETCEDRIIYEYEAKDEKHSVFKSEAEYNDFLEKFRKVMG